MIINFVDMPTMLQYLQSENKILNYYLEEFKKRSYKRNELQSLLGEIEIIEMILQNLNFANLKNLLFTDSKQRLKKIISGADMILDIINCPDDYKLIPNIDNLDDINTKDAVVFLEIKKKYCLIKHKDNCTDGMFHIKGRWQNM